MISRDACTLLRLFNSGVVCIDAPSIYSLTRMPPERINMAVFELKNKDFIEDFTSHPFNPGGFRFFSIRLTARGQKILANSTP